MAELPKHHHWTRWWLKRKKNSVYDASPNRIILFDRMLREEIGEALCYPQDLNDAIQQLNSLRQRDGETVDNFIFCDGEGNLG